MTPIKAEDRCPRCGGPLTIQDAETETPVFRQAPRMVGRIEMVRRPCVAAFCSECEFVIEVKS